MGKRVVKTVVEIIILFAVIVLVAVVIHGVGVAETYDDVTEAYILCDDYVNVRPFPNKKGEPIGRFEAGDKVFLDGKKKNGYLHCVDTGLEADGWVFSGFVVYDEPIKMYQSAVIVSKGRLAARKYVGGKRTRWLKPLATLKVWYWSDDWCLTNCGYVQTKYLELEGE